MVDHTEGIDLVAETALFLKILRKNALSGMAEGGMSKIVPYTYSPGKVGIKSQRLADSHRYGGHMHHMLHPSADMVVVRSKEDLGLVLQPPVGIGVDDGCDIPEKRSPDVFYPGIISLL